MLYYFALTELTPRLTTTNSKSHSLELSRVSEFSRVEIGWSSVSIPLYVALTDLPAFLTTANTSATTYIDHYLALTELPLLSDRYYFPASFSSHLLLPIICHIPAIILLASLRLPIF